MVTHQSHIGHEKGQTDSSHKLERLKLPTDLSGKSLLDIGCNEGFFCDQALKRNASKVLGIDLNQEFLTVARGLYNDERLEFRQQSWKQLPRDTFDIVLWTSAMHYELDPATVLKEIASILSPDGFLVLECGVSLLPRKEMYYSLRHDGGLWYPTMLYLEKVLTACGFSIRVVSEPETVGTDPVPRAVFHCYRQLPVVLLVTGTTRAGKSTLASLVFQDATKVIALDHFVSRIYNAKWVHTDLEKHIKENLNPHSLGGVYESIDQVGLTQSYAKLLAKSVAASDKLVVIEGMLTQKQIRALTDELNGRAKIWIASRSE